MCWKANYIYSEAFLFALFLGNLECISERTMVSAHEGESLVCLESDIAWDMRVGLFIFFLSLSRLQMRSKLPSRDPLEICFTSPYRLSGAHIFRFDRFGFGFHTACNLKSVKFILNINYTRTRIARWLDCILFAILICFLTVNWYV